MASGPARATIMAKAAAVLVAVPPRDPPPGFPYRVLLCPIDWKIYDFQWKLIPAFDIIDDIWDPGVENANIICRRW